MKVGQLLLILFAASMVAGAIQLGIILALIVGVITKPRETFGLLLLMAFVGFADSNPWTAAFVILLLLFVAGRCRRGAE